MLSLPRNARRVPRVAIVVTLALLAAWPRAFAQDTARAMPGVVRRYRTLVRSEFSGDRALATVAFVERFFRVPGNAGFDSSIDRVASLLREAGYVPEADAGRDTRLTYRIERRAMPRPTWEPLDAELRIEGRPAPLLRFATNRNMLAIYSYSTPDTGIRAELVFVGRGAAADYDATNVAGRIVLAEGNVGRAFTEAVVKRGALGVLSYGMPAYTEPEKNTASIQFGSIPLDTARRSWGIPLSKAAYDTLRAALARGPVVVRVRARSRMYRSVERTLVAEVRGTDHPEERFVLTAHVQEPGANDNASGVGTLSEGARVLAALVRRGDASPRRTITMIFGNEIEQTRNFLADDAARARGVRWGMSLDMVGEDTRRTGGTFLIEKMPDPSAIWTRGEDHHTAWGGSPVSLDALRPHYYNDFVLNRCLDQAEGTGWVVRTNPFEGGSDHVPFLDAGKPGVLLWHFTDHFYHTDADRLDKVSPDEMKNSGTCALLSALTLTAADGPTTRELVAEEERAAVRRLDAELALGRQAVAGGGDPRKEETILRTWTDWYVGALGAMQDIEVGGSSAATLSAIAAAQERIRRAGADHVAGLRS